jgi:hypothetical protein
MEREKGNRWLRHHFHEFVFPAFMAAEKQSSEIGKPFDVKPSPKAPETLPLELRKMWTLCMEHKVPWAFDVRQLNQYGGTSKYREKARIHNRILNDELAAARAALRDEGCTRLFLGGRDTWPMAILCAKHRIPFRFVPELSRPVSQRAGACRRFLETIGFHGDELFLDTGFAGSIPRAIQKYFPECNLKFRLISQTDIEVVEDKSYMVDCDPASGRTRRDVMRYRRRPNQLLPNRIKAREEALETEYLAKYWKSGTYESLIHQGFAPAVFKEWKERKGVDGLGLRRFVKRQHNVQNLGIYDGREVVFVGENDMHLAAGFKEWWLSLPTIHEPDVEAETEKVIQYFSDRESIQRAALLTCMIWRGIPYWKSAMHSAAERSNTGLGPQMKGFVNQAVGNAVMNTANLNQFTVTTGGVFTNTNAVFTQNFNVTGGTATVVVDQFGNQILNPNVIGPQVTTASTALTAGAVQQALNAVPQYVGQLATQKNLQMLAAATKQAMLQGPPGPAQLPPSQPWPQDQQPIKPDKIIILAVPDDFDDIPIFVDDGAFGMNLAQA